MPREIAPSFENVDVWIFDLDNTLYPAHCDLFAQVDVRMGEFISDFLGVDRAEARRIQKSYFREYGTTMNGLMNRHNMAPEPFLDYVHDIDVGVVAPDQKLNATLGQLQGIKYVFTNGSVKHAENVLGRLGIRHHFADIFDIVAAGYVPKPAPDTYTRFLGHVRGYRAESRAPAYHRHDDGAGAVARGQARTALQRVGRRGSGPAARPSRNRKPFRISRPARGKPQQLLTPAGWTLISAPCFTPRVRRGANGPSGAHHDH